jgi:hypothetical protein
MKIDVAQDFKEVLSGESEAPVHSCDIADLFQGLGSVRRKLGVLEDRIQRFDTRVLSCEEKQDKIRQHSEERIGALEEKLKNVTNQSHDEIMGGNSPLVRTEC